MRGLIVVLGVGGCTCPETRLWSEIEVVVPDYEVPMVPEGIPHTIVLTEPSMATELRSAVTQFADWSGLERVCATTITVSPPDLAEAEGEYDTRSGQIEIHPEASWPYEATVHELCHAVDETLGRISLDHPKLFPAERLKAEDHYGSSSRRTRTREVFARQCEAGPPDAGRRTAWAGCGADNAYLSPVASELLQDQVFPGAPTFAWDEPGLGLEEQATWSLDPPEDAPEASLHLQSDGVHVVALWERGAGRAWDVDHLDPLDGSVAGTTTVRPCPGPEACEVRVLSSPTGPWLYTDEGRLWELRPEGSESTRNAFCESWPFEVLADGRLWDAWHDDILLGCDPEIGDWTYGEVDEGPLRFDARVEPLEATALTLGDGPALFRKGVGAAWLDDDDDVHQLSLPWGLRVDQLAATPDGRWLALLVGSGEAEQGLATVARIDPRAGELVAPTDPCLLGQDADVERELVAGDGWALVVETSEGAGATTVRPLLLDP